MPRNGSTPETEKIGAVIRELRQSRELTVTALAERIGRSQQSVSDWERGHRSPSLLDLTRLARGLRVSPASLAKKILENLEDSV